MRPCCHEDFMKKYGKLLEICSKNLENYQCSFDPCQEEVTGQLPGAFELANRTLVTWAKSHVLNLPIFITKNLSTWGPEMPSTVDRICSFYLETNIYRETRCRASLRVKNKIGTSIATL